MQTTAVIRLLQGRLAWYPPGASEEPLWLDDEAARDRLLAALQQRRMNACFAAPGADVRLLSLQLGADEKKHIARSLPFMLEEQVAEDIEELHFASGALGDSSLAVAICSQQKMAQWQASLAQLPGISRWLPEPLLLPWQSGECCILLEGDEAIIRYGECEGCSIERAMVPVLLSSLDEQTPPDSVVVYGQDQQADTELLPQAWHDNVQWRRGNLYSALLLGDASEAPVNLLQGAYLPRLPLGRWWRQWRAVAALLAIAFSLQLVASYVDYRELKRENLALRSAIQDSYRQAYPKGAIVDPEKQLRRQLDSLRGSAQSGGFVSLMERVGAVVAASAGTSIASINYSDKTDEMRMNIIAADFETVERVREQINKAGLQAVMESSNAQGERVRARLRVGERS